MHVPPNASPAPACRFARDTKGAPIEVHGNLTGLAASEVKRLEGFYRRRIPAEQIITPELSRALCELAGELGRQVGLLVDRRGHVQYVVVGDAHKLFLPDLGRGRAGSGRFRGLRLLHTHLRGEALSRDDLTDLALLRLDLVAALAMDARHLPQRLHCAHLLPDNPHGELWRVLDPMSPHHAELDFERFVRELEDEFARKLPVREVGGRERALLVHIFVREHDKARGIGAPQDAEERVFELKELARTAGVSVVGTLLQKRAVADPRTLIGKGKLEEAVLRGMQLGAEVLIFDQNLTPSQARNVADLTDMKIVDRTQLILDIFAKRAHSRDGKVQVELAQMRYLVPRLAMKQEALSRLTGGIGGQGPGETTLEIHKRRARDRMTRLEKEIEHLAKGRGVRRQKRGRKGVPIVAIVGYTNAGKSTLFNAVTNATVLAEDKLFATLDPTSRRLRFPEERELILTDTVGFIRELPPDLINAFRATLEELYDADLLLHLCDAADPFLDSRIESVDKLLRDMELHEVPRIMVFNKQDLVPEGQAQRMAEAASGLAISAIDTESTRHLMHVVQARLWEKSYGDPIPEHEGESHKYADQGRAPVITHVDLAAADAIEAPDLT